MEQDIQAIIRRAFIDRLERTERDDQHHVVPRGAGRADARSQADGAAPLLPGSNTGYVAGLLSMSPWMEAFPELYTPLMNSERRTTR